MARDERRILRAVDLEVTDGHLCAVVGPSGAGKTTLLRAVAGLIPYQGTVRLDDEDVSRHRAHRRGTALLFQEPRLFDNMSVVDNVAYAARLRRVPKVTRRHQAQDLLSEIGLGDLASSRPPTLSGGERQRVALARALTASPRALLLDEPLNAVDGPRRVELRTVIADACRARDLTTVVVTHDVDDAMAIADSVAVIIDGHVVQVAPPALVRDRPVSAGVARLFGNPNIVVRDDVQMTVRPERVRLVPPGASGGTEMAVSAVDRGVTVDTLHLASPWGPLCAHVLAGGAPVGHSAVSVHIAEGDWWTFPDQTPPGPNRPTREQRHDDDV